MAIVIKEILASDTISQASDKINFNFDQLLLNGGGPAGPQGVQGFTGPVGPQGTQGPIGPQGTQGSAGTDATASGWALAGHSGSSTFASYDLEYVPPLNDLWSDTGNQYELPAIVIGAYPSGAPGYTGTENYTLPAGLLSDIDIENGSLFVHARSTDSGVPHIVLSGGVSTNTEDITRMSKISVDQYDAIQLIAPKEANASSATGLRTVLADSGLDLLAARSVNLGQTATAPSGSYSATHNVFLRGYRRTSGAGGNIFIRSIDTDGTTVKNKIDLNADAGTAGINIDSDATVQINADTAVRISDGTSLLLFTGTSASLTGADSIVLTSSDSLQLTSTNQLTLSTNAFTGTFSSATIESYGGGITILEDSGTIDITGDDDVTVESSSGNTIIKASSDVRLNSDLIKIEPTSIATSDAGIRVNNSATGIVQLTGRISWGRDAYQSAGTSPIYFRGTGLSTSVPIIEVENDSSNISYQAKFSGQANSVQIYANAIKVNNGTDDTVIADTDELASNTVPLRTGQFHSYDIQSEQFFPSEGSSSWDWDDFVVEKTFVEAFVGQIALPSGGGVAVSESPTVDFEIPDGTYDGQVLYFRLFVAPVDLTGLSGIPPGTGVYYYTVNIKARTFLTSLSTLETLTATSSAGGTGQEYWAHMVWSSNDLTSRKNSTGTPLYSRGKWRIMAENVTSLT